MAARRARQAAAEAPPPPPPEPVPEPEPEPKEPEPTDRPSTKEEVTELPTESTSKEGKVTERIIERIIICPGGNPYPPMPPVAPQGHCHCPPQSEAPKKRRKRKGRKDEEDEDEPCKHPFCIVQRARNKPQGLPWASGLYKGQPCPQFQAQGQGEAAKPRVVICHRPVICCCRKCRPPEDSETEDSEPEDPVQTDTQQFMTFMNMVFAASNVINERPNVF